MTRSKRCIEVHYVRRELSVPIKGLYNSYKIWNSFSSGTYKGKSKTVKEWDTHKVNAKIFEEYCIYEMICMLKNEGEIK